MPILPSEATNQACDVRTLYMGGSKRSEDARLRVYHGLQGGNCRVVEGGIGTYEGITRLLEDLCTCLE